MTVQNGMEKKATKGYCATEFQIEETSQSSMLENALSKDTGNGYIKTTKGIYERSNIEPFLTM